MYDLDVRVRVRRRDARDLDLHVPVLVRRRVHRPAPVADDLHRRPGAEPCSRRYRPQVTELHEVARLVRDPGQPPVVRVARFRNLEALPDRLPGPPGVVVELQPVPVRRRHRRPDEEHGGHGDDGRGCRPRVRRVVLDHDLADVALPVEGVVSKPSGPVVDVGVEGPHLLRDRRRSEPHL